MNLVSMKRIDPRMLLATVILIAFLLRVWGIDFDLPYIYHPDEPVPIAISQRMLKIGDLNPRFFHWPSLPIYLNLLAYVPYYLVGRLLGVFHSPTGHHLIALAHFFRTGRAGLRERNLHLALGSAGLAFLATTPFAVLNLPTFFTDLQFDSQHYAIRHAGMQAIPCAGISSIYGTQWARSASWPRWPSMGLFPDPKSLCSSPRSR